jgi:hypothetical protein
MKTIKRRIKGQAETTKKKKKKKTEEDSKSF